MVRKKNKGGRKGKERKRRGRKGKERERRGRNGKEMEGRGLIYLGHVVGPGWDIKRFFLKN